MNSGLQEQLPASPNSVTYSFSIVELPAKSLLFATRQSTLILHLCVFIPVLNVPFRTLTLNNPSLHATTGPDVWLRLSPLLYSWTGPRLGQKAWVKQRDYQYHSHWGTQTVTQIKATPSWPLSHLRQVSSHILKTSAQTQLLKKVRQDCLPAMIAIIHHRRICFHVGLLNEV